MTTAKTRADAKASKRSEGSRLPYLLAFIGFMVLVNFGITQWVAYRLAYHPALGDRFLGLYAPWAWFDWLRWYDHATDTFNTANLVLLVSVLVSVTAILLTFGKRHRSAQAHESLHGTAHWADEAEVRATGLLPSPGDQGAGVYVGGWQHPKTKALHYLRHDGPEHVIALAPTRSGKGVSLVVPTCLSWPHSMVIHDQKGELWNLSAGWRAKEAGNHVLKFDPASETDCVAFNPLDEIRVGTPSEVGDAQNLVTIMVDPDGKGLVDHWAKTSHAFLTGVVLHLLYKAKQRGPHATASLYDVAFALSDPSREVDELYQEMLANTHDVADHYQNGGVHPVVASAARDMLNKPDDERGSVLSTAMSFLSLYRDPIVRRNTARSDFSIMDLMNADRPVSLYLVVRAEDKDRMRPLMRLVLNQIVRVLLRPEIQFQDGRAVAPHRHRLLLMLDEFASFGKLEIFEEALAYIAGYGIKAYLIVQDVAQLYKFYTREESVTSNCHIRVAFAPNKVDTAEWLSKMSGTSTEIKWQITESGKRFGATAESFSRTSQEVSRPLLTADEAMRLRSPVKAKAADGREVIVEPGDMVTFVAGHAPILGTQTLYFLDPTFLNRSRTAVPRSSTVRSNPAAATAAPVLSAPAATPSNAAALKIWGTADESA